MITLIVGRDGLNRYVDTNVNMYLDACSSGPFLLDNANEIEKNSQLCASSLHSFPRGQSYTKFEKSSDVAKMLCFSDIAAFVFNGIFYRTTAQWRKNKVRTIPWKRLEQVGAFIRILNKNNSLGARSHRSLKLFTHLSASVETSQECLLALWNVEATMRPGSMRDKFMNVGFHLLERASRLLNYNKVKNGAKVFSFASKSPRILTSNSPPFYLDGNRCSLSLMLSNPLSIHYFFENWLSIHYLFHESTSNSLSISRIHFQFTIYFTNSLSIHYFFANQHRIHYLFREFTYNSLSFSRIHF